MSQEDSYPPIGAYQPLALLGRGGMAEVFRVRHTLIGSEFALKRMLPELALEPKMRALFEEELRILAKLRHPNIVGVHDVFSAEDGAPVIVMDLVLAPTLRKVMGERALSVEEIIHAALAIASGLGHAHRERLVHCDLKPDNVLVPAGQPERSMIIDFGIARLQSSRDRTTRVGTVPYMAPEQLEGRDVDPRTDLFSLGVLLFEMLEGRVPVESRVPEEALKTWRSLDIVFVRGAEAPRDLHDLCRQCLSLDPAGRPENAESVVQRLRYIDAARRTFVDSSWNRHAPAGRVSTAGVILAGIGLALAGWWWWTRPASLGAPIPARVRTQAETVEKEPGFAMPLVPLQPPRARAQARPRSIIEREVPGCDVPPCPALQRLDETEDLFDPNAEDESLAND